MTPATRSVGAIPRGGSDVAQFTVTPAAGATVNQNYKIAARYTSGAATGYTDDVVRVVAPAEGRFQRFGKWAEYDEWLEDEGSSARRLNRSAAIQSMGVGETITVPVVVHNWSSTSQSGNVSLAPADRNGRRRGDQALRAAGPRGRPDGELLRLQQLHQPDAAGDRQRLAVDHP